ncbi:RNA polymerase II-associated protein 3 isoform X1 [Bombus impatiens]|uniref:RNA polymerase II-associated protein 3 n=1 Tax=Bombus impatiens TaxID=132113 RepID=A0A6P3USF6_BOMIM|nr:RNA polymerase II-associated protein 3 isoform X1 [Bombus impatiens]XP_012239844.1 RNA polymerase II-associated protein 3 isoform X1 [Bombus impatiens]XP_033176072.1 RNA polymerase II-associated protein 3 isoform X1 [Bombus impatiens]
MDKSILMQKQVKDNAEDLQKEFLDMKNWEEQMRCKDEQLRKEKSGQITLPPIRSKHKNKTKNSSIKKDQGDNKSKRIKSHDYSAWEKFDVDKECRKIDNNEQSDDSEDEHMSKEELEKAHQKATKHKSDGNILVQQQKWSEAIGCYTEAIKLFPYDAVFYANRALCQLKLDNFYSAESDCSTAVQLDESYVKAYHRRATARMNLKQYKEAKHDLEKVLKLEPSNKEAKLLLNQIESKIKCSETSTIAKEGTKMSTIEKKDIKKTTIEKKISEKTRWNDTASNVQTTKAKNIINAKNMEKSKDNKSVVNVKDSTENEKDNVIDTNAKRDPRIPDWLPEKDEVIVIEPIEKPPHLRSKKSLTKIPIQEVEFGIDQYRYTSGKTAYNNKDDPVQTKEPHKDPVQKVDMSQKDNVAKDNTYIKVSEPLEDISNIIPPIPKTAVQFLMNWKRNNLPEFRYKYLKQLSEGSLPKIFQDSMESDIFSQIIEVLGTEFVGRKNQIFYYLKDLSRVKRFRALIMFTSNSDKENLKILFEYCKTVENVSEDEISALQDKYEM